MPETKRVPWQLSGSWSAAVLLGIGSLVAGLIAGRPDVVVTGIPLVLVAAVALNARHQRPPTVQVDEDGGERDDELYTAPLGISSGAGLATVAVTGAGSRPDSYVLDTGDSGLKMTIQLPLSGQRDIYVLSYSAISADSSLTHQTVPLRPKRYTVLPDLGKLPALPLPPRLSGLTGDHASRIPGDGGELRDIHPFQAGDQLRRIDWRATARLSPAQDELYVRRTYTTSEASIMMLVDTESDLTAEAATWYGGDLPSPLVYSSLHLARSAATVVAASYLARGDRVGLMELASYRRGLRVSAGRRQLELIRLRLTSMRASTNLDKPAQDPVIPSAALVMVFSPFMNDDGERLLLKWQHLGHTVVGIDTLPHLNTSGLSATEELALRMELMSRRDRIARLKHGGVPVFGWRGPERQDVRGGGRLHGLEGSDAAPDQLSMTTGLQMLGRSAGRSRRPAGRSVR
ncbi:DUF58 domain-containing protein [Arthrobacter sp. H14]|uniref:DUF58 domain-containing protein n=1 Tax=Arthrobacter sp. H14 TaxID=1312959 RepID=UPI00047A1E7B|nr:DUF58 domain-containing protein [Arthrobacter sp. H14]